MAPRTNATGRLPASKGLLRPEEFADHVSAFKFGTLVGETTGGGGFRNTFVPLPGGLVMSVSIGRAVHMVTGKDWEGAGVSPDVNVPPAEALLWVLRDLGFAEADAARLSKSHAPTLPMERRKR